MLLLGHAMQQKFKCLYKYAKVFSVNDMYSIPHHDLNHFHFI